MRRCLNFNMFDELRHQKVKSVGIRPNSSILSVLSHLNYKAWFAVAEFVDNSLQSYFSNRERLRELHGEGFVLNIRVWLDQKNDLIEITDNAAGIKAEDFPRAFRPAEIPADRTGLSEFGMGMKTAACWFTHTWNVRTKAIDEDVERSIRFDLNDIVSSKLDELQVIESPAHKDDHYTVLRLEGLGKKFPVKRTQKKLRDHLASIYRMYLRTKEIELYFDEDQTPLKYEETEVQFAPSYNTPDTPPIQWRKTIDFELAVGRKVWGFAALRNEASTSHAGFALFRRNRLIVGSDDETYRPSEIFGNANSFRYQRLFGELHVEGFEVSHTKDGFRWEDFEEEFLTQLRDHLRDANLDLLKQADNFRVRPSKTALQPLLTRAAEAIAGEITRTGSDALSIRGTGNDLADAARAQPPPASLVATEKNFQLLIEDHVWNVLVRTSVDPSVTEWVRVKNVRRQQLINKPITDITIDVCMAHPFVQQFIGPRNENAELFLRLAVGFGLASEKSKRAGYSVDMAMLWLNRLLRESLSGGRNDGVSQGVENGKATT